MIDHEAERKREQELQALIEQEPDNSTHLLNLGDLYFKQGKIEQGFDLYNKAKEIDPNNARVHHERGSSLQKQERFDEAEAEFKIAADMGYDSAKKDYLDISVTNFARDEVKKAGDEEDWKKREGMLRESIEQYRSRFQGIDERVHSRGLLMLYEGLNDLCSDPESVIPGYSLEYHMLLIAADGKRDWNELLHGDDRFFKGM